MCHGILQEGIHGQSRTSHRPHGGTLIPFSADAFSSRVTPSASRTLCSRALQRGICGMAHRLSESGCRCTSFGAPRVGRAEPGQLPIKGHLLLVRVTLYAGRLQPVAGRDGPSITHPGGSWESLDRLWAGPPGGRGRPRRPGSRPLCTHEEGIPERAGQRWVTSVTPAGTDWTWSLTV